MAIRLKTPPQIEQMREAGRIVRAVLNRLGEMIAPGVTTQELDAEAETVCRRLGGTCLFKGVVIHPEAGPFPGNICASVNEEVVHGVPSSRALAPGDIISVDFGVKLGGWCGDAAETFIVGQVPPDVKRLVDVTRNSLELAVRMCRPGGKWIAIARAMQEYVEGEGFSVVRDYVGHGIGQEMHEKPKVPNFVSRELMASDIYLQEGLVLAVEPMVNMGSPDCVGRRDRWPVLTRDRKPSAHFEHTLAITRSGVEVLTG